MIFSSCRLFCSFRPATFLGKSAFPDSIWVIPEFLLHIFILASCIIFSSKAVQLSDSRLPAEAETPLTLISVSLLFPGCIVCCLPCCSITLIYVLSLLCLSFHTSPYEKPRSPPPSLTSVSSLNLSVPPSRISMQLTLTPFSFWFLQKTYWLKATKDSSFFIFFFVVLVPSVLSGTSILLLYFRVRCLMVKR